MVGLAIFLGSGLGGLARYATGIWVQDITSSEFPWGTLVINVSGSLLLAFVYGILDSTSAGPEWRAFLGIGVLGGYTTFSAFSYEAMRLIQDGDWGHALGYVLGSVIVSLAAALLGFRLASDLLRWR